MAPTPTFLPSQFRPTRVLFVALAVSLLRVSSWSADLTLTWSDNSDNETGFKVERSSDGTVFAEAATVGADIETYTDTGLDTGREYWFRVCAFNDSGNSGFTDVVSATTAGSPPPNTAPTVSDIPDQTIQEDETTGPIPVVVGDAESSADSLTLSASSSDTSLVPIGGIDFGGSGSSRTVTITPSANESGTATITVTVSDGSLTASDTFTVTLSPVNDEPVISNITDKTIPEDGSTGAIGFTVSDLETAADSLSVTGNSSNTSLVPLNGIVFSGTGSNRTVTVTPDSGKNGTAAISVTVSDGDLSDSDSFVVTITVGSDTTFGYDLPSGGSVTLNAQDIGVVGSAGATSYDSGSNTFTTVAGGVDIWGTADGFHYLWHQVSGDFEVVAQVNSLTNSNQYAKAGVMIRESLDPDSIHALANLNPSGSVNLVYRSDTGGTSSADSASVSAPAWVRLERSGILVTASYSTDGTSWSQIGQRSLNFSDTVYVGFATTAHNTSDTITAIYSSYDVALSVSPPANTAPSISNIGNLTIDEDGSTGPIAFTVSDVESSDGSLSVSGGSSNPSLVPLSGVVFGGSGGNRTVTVTPATNQSGSATITVTVGDGLASVSDSFVLTVTASPDPVTVSVVSPTEGAIFEIGDTISGEALTSDISRTATVEFFHGSNQINTERQSPYTFNWTPSTAGSYAIKAIVTDTDGATTESVPISISVADPTPEPLTVSLSSPADGADFSFSDTINVTAIVSDVARTNRVELLVDGSKIGEDANSPFVILWSGAEAGSHTLQLRAVDLDAESVVSQVVTINVTEPALTVSFVQPSGDTVVEEGETVMLEAITSDISRTAKVDFYLDGSVIGSASSEPYRVSWKAQSKGTHVVQAEAHENNGKKALSKTASITVNEPVLALEIVVTNPVPSDTLTVGDDVSIEADVTANGVTVGRVEFTVNGVKIGQSNSAPYSANWIPLEPGSYTISARAVVPGGVNVLSVPVTVSAEASTNPDAVPSGVYRGKFKKIRPGKDIVDGIPVAEDEVTETGSFAIHVNEYGLMTFLGYDADSGTGFSSKSIRIAEDGTFEIPGKALGLAVDLAEPQAVPPFARGRIGAKGIEGIVDGTELIVSGFMVDSTGPAASASGAYELMGVRTSDTFVQVIVGADGIAYAYAADEGTMMGDEVLVNISESGIYLASEVLALEVVIDTLNGGAQGLLTSTSGEVSSLMGIRNDIDPERRLLNISTRGSIGSGSNVMITGFVVSGTEPKTVLIRAIGPGLAEFGVSTHMIDPVLDLIGDSGTVSSNAHWILGNFGSVIESVSTRIGAFALTPESLDAALLVTVAPGRYSAVVRDASRIGGDALVEVYDATDLFEPGNDLINLSTRGSIGAGKNLIGGFVITGNVPKHVLIRGVGPGLGVFGVSDALPSAKLVLTQRVEGDNVRVAENASWTSNPDSAAIVAATESAGAFLLDSESDDSVLLLWLEPGIYTAEVQPGRPGATGTALIEVYQVD